MNSTSWAASCIWLKFKQYQSQQQKDSRFSYMLSTKRLLTLKSMGKFKCVCKPQETHLPSDIQPVLQLMVACSCMQISDHSCLLLYLSAAFSGWQVCENAGVLRVKRKHIKWLNGSGSLITWLAQCFLSLCVQLPIFSLCLYMYKCVFVCTRVHVFFCTSIFFQNRAFSCIFCLSATDNIEPSRDCLFSPSLTIPLLSIHKTFLWGKFYINTYLSSH